MKGPSNQLRQDTTSSTVPKRIQSSVLKKLHLVLGAQCIAVNSPAGWFINDENLDVAAVVAAPDMVKLKLSTKW